jgi:hypothetical protein
MEVSGIVGLFPLRQQWLRGTSTIGAPATMGYPLEWYQQWAPSTRTAIQKIEVHTSEIRESRSLDIPE